MNPTPSRPCAPRARCGDFRSCPICARIRQARIADAAERLQSFAGDLTWSVVSPHDRSWEALTQCRSAFLAAENPQGALWTVEYGALTGKPHANILHPTSGARTLRRAAVWQAPVKGSARLIAAYVSKQSQMPPRAEYSGRLFGTAGPLWQWLATGKGLPVIEAAKTQWDIDPGPVRASSGIPDLAPGATIEEQRQHFRAIAARRLPDLLRAVPLLGASRKNYHYQPPSTQPTTGRAYTLQNSRRVRWLSKTPHPWEKDWKPGKRSF